MTRVVALLVAANLCFASQVVGVELRGTVLKADGSPAEGARVSAAAMFYEPALRHEATTDAHGQFRLELRPLQEPQRWAVCARLGTQGGEANNTHGTIKIDAGMDLAPVVIRLQQRGIVRGRVLQAEDDRPIAGAKLFLDSGEVLTTDAEGRYSRGGLPLKGHSLIPVAPGRVRRYILFDNSLRPDTELDIRLERGGKITGRVVDQEGRPIPGAYLSRASSGTALTLNGWDQVCNADGSFVYDGLFLERLFYSLEAAAPGFQPQRLEHSLPREGRAATEAVFQLKREAAAPGTGDLREPARGGPSAATAKLPRRDMRGTVIGANQKPVAGAIVRWGATMYEATQREVKTGPDGAFRLADVPDRDGYVTVMAEGYAPQFVSILQGKTDLAVALEAGKSVRGIVRNSAGKPVEGVHVVPVLASPDPSLCNPLWLRERSTHTDAQGRFEISSLPADGVCFDFLHEYFSDHRNVALKLDEENAVTLTAGGAIRGLVLDPAGGPVRDFRIRLEIPRNLQPGEQAGGYYAGFDWYGASFTSADGSFVLSEVPAGSWLRVHAIVPGFGQAVLDRVQAKPMDALPPTPDATFQLTAPHSLRVQVVTEFLQKPVADAVVTLIDEHLALDQRLHWGYDNLWGLRGWTDKEGLAAFLALAFAEATVAVECPGYARQRFGWRKGEKELRVTLAPEAVITGLVRKDSRPLEDYQVRLTAASGDFYHASVEPKDRGEFTIGQLPAGDYKLEILDERSTLKQESLTLVVGEKRSISVDWVPPAPTTPK